MKKPSVMIFQLGQYFQSGVIGKSKQNHMQHNRLSKQLFEGALYLKGKTWLFRESFSFLR
jgi:hypothetical protein